MCKLFTYWLFPCRDLESDSAKPDVVQQGQPAYGGREDPGGVWPHIGHCQGPVPRAHWTCCAVSKTNKFSKIQEICI